MITDGEIRPGDKLPSEAALTKKYKVSRTVIREAIASLRADGLVEAKQGAGVFVLNSQPAAAFPFQAFDGARISSMIEMLELRTAIEIEAAGLAAARRSPAQEEAIFERCQDIDRLIVEGRPTTEADFAFHLAIADATNNPRFREFLEMMGQRVIPRTVLQGDHAERHAEQLSRPDPGRAPGHRRGHIGARRAGRPRGRAHPPQGQPGALPATAAAELSRTQLVIQLIDFGPTAVIIAAIPAVTKEDAAAPCSPTP